MQQTPHQRGAAPLSYFWLHWGHLQRAGCVWGQLGRSCTGMEGAAAPLLLHPWAQGLAAAPGWPGATSASCRVPRGRSCQCQHRGKSRDVTAGLARRAQLIQAELFWICVWVASCCSPGSCQLCLFVTMVWGKDVQEKAQELRDGLKYFSFPLC